jgi:purine nucleoside permease
MSWWRSSEHDAEQHPDGGNTLASEANFSDSIAKVLVVPIWSSLAQQFISPLDLTNGIRISMVAA